MSNSLQVRLNIAKLIMISTNYHNITQLLLVTIIISIKTPKEITQLKGKTG